MELELAATQYLNQLADQHLERHLQLAHTDPSVDFSSNDYLGLSKHPALLDAGYATAREYGCGATGSRLLSGNLACFEALEAQIAEFKRMPAALLFGSGYQANATALSALLDPALWSTKPLVFTDRLNHASLHHACQLTGLKQLRFRHNDLTHLAELLHTHRHNPAPKFIVTETVFGMEGDQLNVTALADLALEHQAIVYLDEAHATGVHGPQGRGLACQSHPAIHTLRHMGHWIVMSTFSKAVGVGGACVVSSAKIRQLLINRSQGFVYSTAPSPFTLGAIAQALTLITNMDHTRQQLNQHAEHLRDALHTAGFSTAESSTHIVPIVVGEAHHALSLKQHLHNHGFIASAVRPPTVPPHTARIRLALNAHHTLKSLDQLLHAVSTWSRP